MILPQCSIPKLTFVPSDCSRNRAVAPLMGSQFGQGVLIRFDTGTGVDSRTPQVVNDSGSVPADVSQLPPEELRK